MKKITVVCQHLGKGGAERVLSILINRLIDYGWNVQLIMLYNYLIDYPISEKVEIVYLGWTPLKNKIRIIDRFVELRKTIEGNCVLAFLFVPIFYTVFSMIGSKKKVIISERADPGQDPPTSFKRMLRNIAYTFADVIVFQTESAKGYFSSIIKKKGVIIPNPISNTVPEQYDGRRRKTIVAVGRLEKQKNFPLLLRSFSRLHKEYPDYNLEIYGQGPELDSLKKLSEELGIGEYVLFQGFVFDVDKSMIDASLYVSSSNYEGISNAMLEALAMGIPTICTDCPAGGAREMITDGINGLLVPVEDDNKMYSAMKSILDNPVFAAQLSEQSIKIRERLSEEQIIPMWLKLMD